MNKNGAEMTIGTIIAITLGVALLVFLIFGFSTQWKAFRGVLDPLAGGDSNIDNMARGCEVACASSKVNAYCKEKITLKFGENYCEVEEGEEEDPDCKISRTGTCSSLEEYTGVTCDIC